MEGTAQMFWERLYAGIVARSAFGKSIDQMKAECFDAIKKRIDEDAGDLPFTSDAYLRKIGMSLVATCLIRSGKLNVDPEGRKMILYINDELDRERCDEIIAHEIGHSYMMDRRSYKFYSDRGIPYFFMMISTPDEYMKTEEDFATEIGAYLMRAHR